MLELGDTSLLQLPNGPAGFTPTHLASKCVGQTQLAPQAKAFSPLTFIHIPRTGGTSIEECTKGEAADVDRWGVQVSELHGQNRSNFPCYKQHVPPNVLASGYYDGKETFCVVRDPFTRMISQHGFANAFTPKGRECSAEDLNSYLREMLQTARDTPECSDCHLLPQAAYVWGWNRTSSSVDRSVQRCDHILRFEYLQGGFDALMEAHGYPYRLSGASAVTKSPPKCHNRFSAADLQADVVALVEEIFQDDFELLGFRLWSSPIGHDDPLRQASAAGEAMQQDSLLEAPAPVPVWVWWDYRRAPESPVMRACRLALGVYAPSPAFAVRFVNSSNIRSLLPDLPPEFERLPYAAAATDLVRAGLLARHGGVYLDTDVLVQRDLSFLTSHLQDVDFVSYAIQSQSCERGTFSSNIMAARRGNALASEWYEEARRQLSQNCQLDAANDTQAAQKVCCYTPSGGYRQWCHVNWGGLGERIAHPTLTRLLSEPKPSIRTFCFNEKDSKGFASAGGDDYPRLTVELPSPASTYDSDRGLALGEQAVQAWRESCRAHAAHSATRRGGGCMVDGNDLICCDRTLRNFFSRGAYHLFKSVWPASMNNLTAADIKNGSQVVSLLIRRSLPRRVVAQL